MRVRTTPRALALAVALVASAAPSAQPVKVAEAAGATYLVDPVSFAAKGELRELAVIHDLAAPEAAGVRSRRVTYEIDCAGQRLRSVAGSEHAQPMAAGAAVTHWKRESEWIYLVAATGSHIARNPAYRAVARYACTR